jgi:hypothetical protein
MPDRSHPNVIYEGQNFYAEFILRPSPYVNKSFHSLTFIRQLLKIAPGSHIDGGAKLAGLSRLMTIVRAGVGWVARSPRLVLRWSRSPGPALAELATTTASPHC